MPNEAKIRETLAVARANQARLDMGLWASPGKLEDGDELE